MEEGRECRKGGVRGRLEGKSRYYRACQMLGGEEGGVRRLEGEGGGIGRCGKESEKGRERVWRMFGVCLKVSPHLLVLVHTHVRTHTHTHACTHTHTHTCILTMHTTHPHSHTIPTLILSHTHSVSSRNRCCIRFLLSRVHMRSMHYAVDHLDLDTIFPPSQSVSVNAETSISIKRCLEELKNSELYSSQQNAITSMLDPACRQVETV